ncbi:MAG: NADH-quinone oxidoreductase subunit C [Acidimicrobiia bacterium]|nr:NADH-quinone oxidoreductase subunit C [Acidimicrobiia bacterium]
MADTETAEKETATDHEPSQGLRYGHPVTSSRGQAVIHVPRDQWRSTAEALFADNWTMLVDITAVDFLSYGPARQLPDGVEPQRFEVVASFVRFDTGDRLRMRTQVPEDDPTLDSLYAVYPGSDYQERETFDMFGITFEGHPDLSRILMPEEWVGYPLRKDFAQGEIPVQFKAPQAERGPDR